MMRYIRHNVINLDFKLLWFVFAVAFCMFGGSVAVGAAGLFADDPCDPDYYESLKSRAWLEAQREITQNQNLIFKPDSVLEYSCFDQFLNVLAEHAGPPPSSNKMFTGTDRWGRIVPGNMKPGNMKDTLTDLVAVAMDQYDESNFNHHFLGGRDGAPQQQPSQNPPVNLPDTVTPGAYTCSVMNGLWNRSRCMDFANNPANDGFFTFSEYDAAPEDKRFAPAVCPKNADFEAAQDLALDNATTAWEEDDVVTYFELFYPPSGCGPNSGDMVSKIRTGLVVNRTSGGLSKFNEYICVVPGCHYEPSGLDTGTCVQ